MQVIEFNPGWSRRIVVCMVDNTQQYLPSIRELIKNQSDGVLDNLYRKGYHVLVSTDENHLLNYAANLDYDYALVFSTGTEFVNGREFFNSIDELISDEFFIAGHVLDRKEGYYELHHQCYVINLNIYKDVGRPEIGIQQLYSEHIETEPCRSNDNYHDDYTPLWVIKGYTEKSYRHRCHGWNMLRVAFEHDLPVKVFNDDQRKNKIHFYPESPEDFYKQLSWAYHRLHYCQSQHVHTEPTESIDLKPTPYEQIITPASGAWFEDYTTDDATVVYYDYNQRSLDYWQTHAPKIKNIKYEFVLCDLLADSDFLDRIDCNKKTLINLSNIFNYEGTTFFYSKNYRIFKEQQLLEKIKNKMPGAEVYFTMRSKLFDALPTWHINS